MSEFRGIMMPLTRKTASSLFTGAPYILLSGHTLYWGTYIYYGALRNTVGVKCDALRRTCEI